MPFSFIEIEEKKSRVIFFVFLFLIFFYFLTAYLLLVVLENSFGIYSAGPRKSLLFLPPVQHTLIALIVAFFAGLIHWQASTSNLIEKITSVVGAKAIDQKDAYHQYLKNIVDEVSVAIGGRHIEAMVIPSASMNAFSLEDFDRRAVIGVTEGLLSRLSRAQIAAVVAHEAGHIVSRDSLTTTVMCSLAEIYEESLSRIKSGLRHSRGRGQGLLGLIFIVLGLMNFLSSIIRYFISRQREYRADAIAVRLSRDPLSLAEALKLISKNWRGAGGQGERVESIFIVSPKFNRLDEEEGLIADIFSTHPPVKNRINILLNMAHMDEKTLEENLKNFQRVSPVAKSEFKPDRISEVKKWLIFKEQKWLGPFLLEDLQKFEGLKPDQWVRMEGQDTVMPAYEDEDLRGLFKKDKEEKRSSCPHCKIALDEIIYEGVSILKCSFCEGVFVEEDKVSRILIREDRKFSEDTMKLAETILNSGNRYFLKNTDEKSVWVIGCPKCLNKMRRQFFVYSYPVEIDRCIYCAGVWFDRQELEILQYIYEHKEQFLG